MDQYIGRLLDGRYEILEVIGTGGMAVVYKARCHRLNRLVAIKILKDEFAGDEEFRRRFHAEGEAVAMLSHPNIVQVYDVSTSDDANYIVMELIDGISLKQYMEKKGILNWKETLHFAMQIAKALEHAHSRGIVHRDIKPHNVMVLKNGSVKVMDFGIARVMNKSNTLTKEALGSVHYISPEQAKGGHTDNRSDLYSLSVVMYEMMAGRPPYDGESAVSVAIQHINGGAPMPSVYNPNIPSGLEQIIMKGMSLEPRDRYDSATDMLRDMEEFRKNPTMTFQYHTVLDDATRQIPTTSPVPPRTVAEKTVQARTGVRPTTDSIRLRQGGTGTLPRRAAEGSLTDRETENLRRAQQRRKAEGEKRKKEQTEERNRVATTAIVICSAVAVCAIILFLLALFNGVLLQDEKKLVDVPYLEGLTYSDALVDQYPDFTIRLQPQQYSDTYLKDQIMKQAPEGGEKVQKGTDLWLTVSLGEEPPVKTMANFVDIDVEQAQAVLIGQGFLPLIRREASDEFESGQIIRTEPVYGTELTDGQTVYLYVSTGKDVVEETMPNVVGMNVEVAKPLLEQLGFTNLRVEAVESSKPAGEVVYQSVEKDKDVDVTSEVIIHYSQKQPETTEAETTEATEATTEPQEQTIPFTFSVPEKDKAYSLDVCTRGTTQSVANVMVEAGQSTVTVTLTGKGNMEFDLYVDGVFERTIPLGFVSG